MTEHKPRVLLIDLENCPSQIYQLMSNLERYSQVVVCYAQSGAKIPIDWIIPLTATINDNRLKLVTNYDVIAINTDKIIYNQQNLNKFSINSL